MPPHRQSGGCWAWVLSPVPPPRLGPHESFVRLRLVGPDSLIDRTAQEFAALGGWASDSTPPSPPSRDGRQVVLAGTVAQLRQLAARGPARAADIVRQGADVIEVGGESAQAGERLDPAVEMDRVVPLVEELVRRYPLPVAVDTYKPDVARAAIQAGAVLINDIAGLGEAGMAEAIAGSDAGVVIMHLHGRPKESYGDLDVPSGMDWVAG